MKIAIGSDHAGFALKQEIIEALTAQGYEVTDYGTHKMESCDYPDYAKSVAEAVSTGRSERGIFICGTGLGPTMAANKVKGIRAALCHDTFSAHQSREHNDANMLCMGARVIGPGLAGDIVNTWLTTDFSGDERHQRRINKVMAMEG